MTIKNVASKIRNHVANNRQTYTAVVSTAIITASITTMVMRKKHVTKFSPDSDYLRISSQKIYHLKNGGIITTGPSPKTGMDYTLMTTTMAKTLIEDWDDWEDVL